MCSFFMSKLTRKDKIEIYEKRRTCNNKTDRKIKTICWDVFSKIWLNNYFIYAITSISTSPPLGNFATSKADLAGYGSSKKVA